MDDWRSAEEMYDAVKASYIIPKAFEKWEDYRKQLTDEIIDYTEPGKSIAIIGVGESNDIDLSRLYEHSGNLGFFDIDVESMERAVEKYGLREKSGISINECDLFGVTRDEYIDLIDKSMIKISRSSGMADFSILSGYMNSIFDHVNSKDVDISREKYDCTVVVGVHSQIVSFLSRIWNNFVTIGIVSDLSIIDKMIRLNETQIPKVNDAVLRMTKEKLIVGVEMYNTRLGKNSTIQGAVQCNHDLNSRINGNELILDGSFEKNWPLSDEKEYRMLFYKMRKA